MVRSYASASHEVLVKQAARWLQRKNCVLVATEFTASIEETPDVVGWDSSGRSVLIECKVTRNDFLRDRMKRARQYTLGDRVRIKELQTGGRVTAVYLGDSGLQYYVRYFHNGESKAVYFFADELEPVEKAP